jgi:hypothetical protein
MLVVFAAVSFAQQITPKKSAEFYSARSKRQKKAANIMLIGGAACLAIDLLIPRGEVTQQGFIFTTQYKNSNIKADFASVGILSMLGSIPFYLLSGHNKRKAKAATVSLNNQKVLIPQQNVFLLKTQPGVTFKLKW